MRISPRSALNTITLEPQPLSPKCLEMKMVEGVKMRKKENELSIKVETSFYDKGDYIDDGHNY